MEEKSTPTLVSVEQVADGWIKKYLLTYRLPNGALYNYEATSRKDLEGYKKALEANAAHEATSPDAVCIVPLLENNEVLLIREFRYPLNSWCIAFPAGLIDGTEPIEHCVERELKEETGYRLRPDDEGRVVFPLELAGYSSTGLTEEQVQVVYALVEPDGEASPEVGELIEPFRLALADIGEFLRNNTTPMGTRCQLVLEALAATQGQDVFERLKDAR